MRKTAMAATAVLALALAPASALAQDDTSDEMSGDDMMTGSMVPHPAHIHAGACPGIGDVVAPLNDVTVVGNEARGAADSIHVDYSLSTVELTLEDILAADHAINVHQSADDMGTYIACGNIGGHDVDGSFLVGLGAVGDSGYSGIAWLTDNGDGTTDVQVAISFSGATEMAMAGMDDMSDDDMSDDGMSDDGMDDMSDDDMSDDDDMEDDG
ncbi:MAG: hypothetical protein AB1Z67_04490 [Candidatus Limnocylindrales bacterium]